MAYDEAFRPQFHFTPAAHWLNDPNGLVYYDGEYHLFYQHYPKDTVWGPMHWGHAVSADLVSWTYLPIALYPDEHGQIYSGSAVIDWHNTAGFGKEAMVAIFTHHLNDCQSQSIAYSIDNGRFWTKFDGNPVIKTPDNLKDFRDPKVFWFEKDGNAGHWIMLVAAGNSILFYSSANLREWSLQSTFGPEYGSTSGVWETPELFELPIGAGPDHRWVLAVATADGAPAGGAGVQYFIGDFDGATFTSENAKNTILWADHGPDFYAPQAWNNCPDGRTIWTAWMNNWKYAQHIPTSTWRGACAFPRELGLIHTQAGIRLTQKPARELKSLRGRRWYWREETISPATSDLLHGVNGETLELVTGFRILKSGQAHRFGIRLRVGNGEQTTVGYDTNDRKVFVDRTRAGRSDFSSEFGRLHVATMEPVEETVQLHILVDRSSVEVYANDGQVVLTERIFPDLGSTGVELFVDGDEVRLAYLDVFELRPAIFMHSPELVGTAEDH